MKSADIQTSSEARHTTVRFSRDLQAAERSATVKANGADKSSTKRKSFVSTSDQPRDLSFELGCLEGSNNELPGSIESSAEYISQKTNPFLYEKRSSASLHVAETLEDEHINTSETSGVAPDGMLQSKARQLKEGCAFYLRLLRRRIIQVKEYHPDPLGRSILIRPSEHVIHIERSSQKPYISNEVTSSRYTVYSFIPRQLLFQFSKVANIYFLTVSILQMIPGLSTTGTYTTIIPLSIFIAIAMAREGYDDVKRHRMDVTENNMQTRRMEVTGHTHIKPTPVDWKDIKVGDLVSLEQNDWVPADLILLNSANATGVAYLETAALDGETSLKTKRVVPTDDSCPDLEDLLNLHAVVHSESPNRNLYSYEGKLTCGSYEVALSNDNVLYRGSILRNTEQMLGLVIFTGEETKIRLNASAHVRIKKPTMQKRVNQVVLSIVAFVVCLAIGCTSSHYIWHSSLKTKFWYLGVADTIAFLPIFVSFLILFNTMVPLSLYVSMEIVKLIQQILLQQDIDMYHPESNTPTEARTSTINEELGQITHIFSDKTGTLTDNEMVFRKLSVAGHAWLHDADIEWAKAEERPFLFQRARTAQSTVKRSATIGVSTGLHTAENHRRFSQGHVLSKSSHALPNRRASGTRRAHSQMPAASGVQRSTSDLLRYIQSNPHTMFARRVRLSLLAIAVCHTVLPTSTSNESIPTYSASSPDELALVNAAVELGYVMINRDLHTITLRTYPHGLTGAPYKEVFQVHEVLEFSSFRKRMSILVTFPDGRICVICKGADSVLLERLRLKDLARRKRGEVQELAKARQSVEAERALARKSMARPSLSRPSTSGGTRLDNIRDLDHFLDTCRDQELKVEGSHHVRRSLQHMFRHSFAIGEASAPLERTENMFIDEKIAANEASVFEETFMHLEQFASEGLRVLLYGHRFISNEEYLEWTRLYKDASTSFEDRQHKIEEVAELIEKDLELTAATAVEDKLQEGVSQSIEKLRRAGIKLWMLTGDKRETAMNIGHSAGLLKDYSTKIVLEHQDPAMSEIMASGLAQILDGSLAHTVVVVDGVTLAVIEGDESLLPLFMKLSTAADSTICCRASPAQKASLVRYVRKEFKSSVTLAIGDGANDIAMIREAHVGIGITGKEGFQAARSSDYSIAQFRFLVKLLLVHGRWNYVRISKYVLGTFYKEMLLFLTQAVYQRFVGYTGTSLHESWDLSLFNTLFSSLAVICIGSFEKDLSASTLLAVPELYETSRIGKTFSIRTLLGWLLLAVSQSVSCFYLAYFAYARSASQDLFPFGNMVFTAIVITINTKLIFVEMHSWSVINYSFFAISIGGWWMWSLLQAAIYGNTSIYFVKDALFIGFGKQLAWWTSLFLVTATVILMDLGIQALRSTMLPTEEDIFRELQTDTALKARLEEEAALELQAGWIEDLLARRDMTSNPERAGSKIEVANTLHGPQDSTDHTDQDSVSLDLATPSENPAQKVVT